jgi:hypothetical protein
LPTATAKLIQMYQPPAMKQAPLAGQARPRCGRTCRRHRGDEEISRPGQQDRADWSASEQRPVDEASATIAPDG